MKKLSDSFRTRSFRAGGYSVLAGVIVLVIAAALNVFAGALPGRITRFDITAGRYFTFSDQTTDLLKTLDGDVTVYWIVRSGSEDPMVGSLLDHYDSLSRSLKVVKKDPDVYPTFTRAYTDEAVYDNSLIVVRGDRSRFVNVRDIYEYDYSEYSYTGSYSRSFAGESALTSAIRSVVSDPLTGFYILTGHGESGLPDAFAAAAERENWVTQELSLLSAQEVPEDARCLLICDPQRDVTEEEKALLLEYVQRGGDLFCSVSPMEADGFPRLKEILGEFGIMPEDGIVVEGNTEHYAYSTPYYLLPAYGEHEITEPLSHGGYYVLLPITQGFSLTMDGREDLEATPLLMTSEEAFSKKAGYSLTTYRKEEDDTDGPFTVAAAVTRTVGDGKQSRLVFVSSASVLDENVNVQVSGGNMDFFMNSLGWICGKSESVSIRAKSMDRSFLTISSGAASFLTVVMAAILPLCTLGIGLSVWIGRKRR